MVSYYNERSKSAIWGIIGGTKIVIWGKGGKKNSNFDQNKDNENNDTVKIEQIYLSVF